MTPQGVAVAPDRKRCVAHLLTRDEECGRSPADRCPDFLPLCSRHLRELENWQHHEQERQRRESWERTNGCWCDGRTAAAHVYYVQRADGLIKIGTSQYYGTRIKSLEREHGPLTLRAVHCGNRDREQMLHTVFEPEHDHLEWFRPEPYLIEHIEMIRGFQSVPGRGHLHEVGRVVDYDTARFRQLDAHDDGEAAA